MATLEEITNSNITEGVVPVRKYIRTKTIFTKQNSPEFRQYFDSISSGTTKTLFATTTSSSTGNVQDGVTITKTDSGNGTVTMSISLLVGGSKKTTIEIARLENSNFTNKAIKCVLDSVSRVYFGEYFSAFLCEEDTLVPKNAVPIEKGMVTKKVYFKKGAEDEALEIGSTIQYSTLKDELCMSSSIQHFVGGSIPSRINSCRIETSNGKIEGDNYLYNIRGSSVEDAVEVTFTKQIELSRGTVSGYIYCVPEEPTITKPNKITEDTTYQVLVDRVQGVVNSISSCKNKLKFILNDKKVETNETDTLSSLIEKIKELTKPSSSVSVLSLVKPTVTATSYSVAYGTLKYTVSNIDPNRKLKHYIEWRDSSTLPLFTDITQNVEQLSDGTFSVSTSQFGNFSNYTPHYIYCFYEDSFDYNTFEASRSHIGGSN